MKLHILNGGILYTEWAFHWHFGTVDETGQEHQASPYRVRNTQYFIDHPKAKIVFDLGFTLEDFQKFVGFPHRRGPEGTHAQQAPDENPLAQLALLGYKPDDIDYVVISHIMSEHAGWLPAFAGTKAKIIVQEKEYDYASRIGTPPIPGRPPAVEQFHSWMYHRKHFEVPGLNFHFIEGDYDLVGDDVTVLSLPGHTPGYQAVLVNLPKTGPVVLSCCEHLGNFYGVPINGNGPGIPHAFTWFAGGELVSLKRVRDLVEKVEGQIFCGHDDEQWVTLKHSPDYYD